MNAYFGDNRIALEPIPNDATAVVVRVETWEKRESALATLCADLAAALRQQTEFSLEAVRLREALSQAKDKVFEAAVHSNPVLSAAADSQAIQIMETVLSSAPTTLREVERVRAMERIMGIVKEAVDDGDIEKWTPSLRVAYLDYEQLVKEKP